MKMKFKKMSGFGTFVGILEDLQGAADVVGSGRSHRGFLEDEILVNVDRKAVGDQGRIGRRRRSGVVPLVVGYFQPVADAGHSPLVRRQAGDVDAVTGVRPEAPGRRFHHVEIPAPPGRRSRRSQRFRCYDQRFVALVVLAAAQRRDALRRGRFRHRKRFRKRFRRHLAIHVFVYSFNIANKRQHLVAFLVPEWHYWANIQTIK